MSDIGLVKPRFLIIGNTGQVGWELDRQLKSFSGGVLVQSRRIDLRNPDEICAVIRTASPNVIINAGAYTAVDKAQDQPSEAMVVNGIAPGVIAEEARRLGALFVHYSSDYVFDGTKQSAYTEEDSTCPLNVYGESKLRGDKAVQQVGGRYLIFRTSWVYGIRGKNFFLTVLRLIAERTAVKIVDDQFGAPTWCHAIAQATLKIVSDLISRSKSVDAAMESALSTSGIYNMSCGGETSWAGFAQAIFDAARETKSMQVKAKELVGIPTAEYPSPVARPTYSVLSNEKLLRTFRTNLPDWNVSFNEMWNEEVTSESRHGRAQTDNPAAALS